LRRITKSKSSIKLLPFKFERQRKKTFQLLIKEIKLHYLGNN